MRIRQTLIGLAAALLVAGCGNKAQNQQSGKSFSSQFFAIENSYKVVGAQITQTMQQGRSMPPGQVIAAFNDEASRLDSMRQKLAALKTPSAGRPYMNQYLQALGRTATDLRAVGKASAGNGTEATGKAIGRRLLSDFRAASQARLALETALNM